VKRRPRDIGTAAETLTVRYLREHGFPQAERRALRGQSDAGDITGTVGLCWEVKGGDTAKSASDNQLRLWLAETDRERGNAQADHGILIVQRPRKNVAAWWAVMWADDFITLAGGDPRSLHLTTTPVRITVADMVGILREHGYGELPEAAA
jgi:hypothetical protein